MADPNMDSSSIDGISPRHHLKRSRRLTGVDPVESPPLTSRPRLCHGPHATASLSSQYTSPCYFPAESPDPLSSMTSPPFAGLGAPSQLPTSTSEPVARVFNSLDIYIPPTVRREMDKIFRSVSRHEAGDELTWSKFWDLNPDYVTLMEVGEKPSLPETEQFKETSHIGFVCDFPSNHLVTGCETFNCPKLLAVSTLSFSPVWHLTTKLYFKQHAGLVPLRRADSSRFRLINRNWSRQTTQALQHLVDKRIRSYNVSLAVWIAKRLIVTADESGGITEVEEDEYDSYFEMRWTSMGLLEDRS
ncbi:hypothetical protein FDECE_8976 [Fusarium decemcellulare]|nr:hypothetical protein FDECE_8976 [Fusarium decemcellulare]